MVLEEKLASLQINFRSGVTRSYAFRKEQLLKLRTYILNHENEIYDALYRDLRKSKEEAWVTEVGILISEINFQLKHLADFMKPVKVSTNLVNLPSRSYILNDPLGVVLIISAWNYPFQLLLNPMVGAIAAGNCIVLKPSEHAPATAALMSNMIRELYPSDYILYVEGDGAAVIPAMMNTFRFDHVFYTGSTAVGRSIYKLAADKLVPVTLELGGKSPCIIEDDAALSVAAKRIAIAKYTNAGQTCIAPDYLLVHDKVKKEFLRHLIKYVSRFYPQQESETSFPSKIINERHFERLEGLAKNGRIVHGGKFNKGELYIEPTIIEDITLEDPIMKEEIFGPILPVIGFSSYEQVKDIISQNPDPLSLYLFTSSDEKISRYTSDLLFGSGAINNAAWQFVNHHLPFGGRGNSGLGSYHGKRSFDVFSHQKSMLKTPTWLDPSVKYPPFKGKLSLFKKFIG